MYYQNEIPKTKLIETRTYGEIKDGVLSIVRRKDFLQSLKLMPNCRVELSVRKAYKKRSTEQNAYYRGVICNDLISGFKASSGEDITNNEAHELLKNNCNYIEINNETTGEVIKKGNTTTGLSTVLFEEYLDRCRAFILSWFGIVVMMPNQQADIMFEEE